MQKNVYLVCECKKIAIFAPQKCFGLWCNGNTADSGPAFPGSSPGSPAKKKSRSNDMNPES